MQVLGSPFSSISDYTLTKSSCNFASYIILAVACMYLFLNPVCKRVLEAHFNINIRGSPYHDMHALKGEIHNTDQGTTIA